MRFITKTPEETELLGERLGRELRGGVKASHVASALAEIGFDVDKKKIKMEPVKTVGSFQAEVRLMENVSAKILVEVVGL